MRAFRFSVLVLAVPMFLSPFAPVCGGEISDLEQAVGLLSSAGRYLPSIGWGQAAGSPNGGLVIGEPLALAYFHGALENDPDLASSRDRDIRRLLNLEAAWSDAATNSAVRDGLTLLSSRVRPSVAIGEDGEKVALWILQNDPGLMEALTIHELGAAASRSEESFAPTYTHIADIECYDTNYRRTGFRPMTCEKGGSTCWVEVPCPMGGGNSTHFGPSPQ